MFFCFLPSFENYRRNVGNCEFELIIPSLCSKVKVKNYCDPSMLSYYELKTPSLKLESNFKRTNVDLYAFVS